MTKTMRRTLPAAGLFLLAGHLAIAEEPAKTKSKGQDAGVAAYIGGEAIPISEVDARAFGKDMKLAQSVYSARRTALEDLVMEHLLGKDAAARGVSVDDLMRQKLAEQVKPVTDDDVKAWYEANRSRVGGNSLEQLADRIKTHLAGEREKQAREDLLKNLRKDASVRILLDAPRANVVLAANDPIKGPPDAPVTIVEVSDFQ